MTLVAQFLNHFLYARGAHLAQIEECMSNFRQDKIELLWNLKISAADKLPRKRESNPMTEKPMSDKQKEKSAMHLAKAGNLSKANQRVCATSTHACREDTVEKLKALHPTDSLDFNKEFWPTAEEMKEHWASDLGQQFLLSRLSIKAIRTYFCTRQALGAADIDGWGGREHIGRMFQNNNHE